MHVFISDLGLAKTVPKGLDDVVWLCVVGSHVDEPLYQRFDWAEWTICGAVMDEAAMYAIFLVTQSESCYSSL